MEQKDYLMREIEKIGVLLWAIIDSLINNKENLSLTVETHFEKTKEILLNEIGFDLDEFLTFEETASDVYLLQFKGMNSGNIELLAEVLAQFGRNEQSENKRLFFKKALQLYALCERRDKTFSFDRERKINELKNSL
ncbi:MAG: hypothetical protein NTU98_13645 [Bacteroidetes bacterium]|nr:hypothetical protein [Bacteroidota bacterium]